MWIYYLIAIILILVILSIVVIYHDTHNFVTREYTFSSARITRDCKAVFLSDLHNYSFGRNNERLLKAIDDIAPDIVICGGDMFTVSKIRDGKGHEVAYDLVRRLSDKYKVFYANGNHECKMKTETKVFGNLYDRYRNTLSRNGVKFLENESIVLEDYNIRITGLDLSLDYFRKVLKKKMSPGHLEDEVGAIKGADRKYYQILLGHNPQYFPEYAAWGADLSLAGHVHGGIIRLPLLGGVVSPSIALFPKYDGGRYEIKGRYMVLGRGLGTHTIHVRMFNPGEIVVLKLNKE